MRPATLTTCLLAAALVPAAAADAAPKPKPRTARHLIADTRGDIRAFDGLDITCGDVTTSRKELVATLTLAQPPGSGTPVGGAEWRLGMTVAGTSLAFRLRTAPGATRSYDASVQAGGVPVVFTYAVSGSTITWRVRRSAVPALARPKIRLTNAIAQTVALGVTADSAATPGLCVL